MKNIKSIYMILIISIEKNVNNNIVRKYKLLVVKILKYVLF